MEHAGKRGRAPEPLVDPKTLADLGFHEVVAEVRRRVSFVPALGLAADLAPIEEPAERRRRFILVAEMAELIAVPGGGAEGWADLGPVDDPFPLVERLEKEGLLLGEELVRLGRLVEAFLALARRVRAARGRADHLRRLLDEALGGGEAERGLEQAALETAALLDPDGNLKDNATGELRRLRARLRGLRKELGERMKGLVESMRAHLQDDYYTDREGRYVLPAKAEARAAVKGIIHGSSASGATVFIEPESVVDDCNRLKVLEGEIQAEEERVRRDLCRRFARHAGELGAMARELARADLLRALARLGADMGGSIPRVVDEPSFSFGALRHPLMALAGRDPVPNDVELAAGQGWIVSGPNAGGKTVLIKAAGLALLMSFCGIPVPAAPGSSAGDFTMVRSVIGDDQSVAQSLSTFSAQIGRLAAVIGAAGPGSLVLVDELATGTEPHEGAALAQEILLELVVGKGAAVMAATHFEELKRLSITHESFTAAGLGFDFDTLAPTYRVGRGLPGVSGGLAVAGRCGLPREIVERARLRIERTGEKLTLRIEELERAKSELARELEEARRTRADIKGKEREVEELKRRLTEKKQRDLTAQQAYLTSELRLLGGELKEAHRILRRRPVTEAAVRSSARLAGKVSGLMAPEGKLTSQLRGERAVTRADPAALAPGARVFVRRLGVEGVFEGLDGRKARVRCGRTGVVVPVEELFEQEGKQAMKDNGEEKDKGAPPDGGAGAGGGGDEEEGGYRSAYNTIDLRGKGLDEALIELDAFIENIRDMGLGSVFVIHGHGTGILKNGIRRQLRRLKTVASFRPGDHRTEGGDGVTVVTLKGE